MEEEDEEETEEWNCVETGNQCLVDCGCLKMVKTFFSVSVSIFLWLGYLSVAQREKKKCYMSKSGWSVSG